MFPAGNPSTAAKSFMNVSSGPRSWSSGEPEIAGLLGHGVCERFYRHVIYFPASSLLISFIGLDCKEITT
jgi:hypothetical protein